MIAIVVLVLESIWMMVRERAKKGPSAIFIGENFCNPVTIAKQLKTSVTGRETNSKDNSLRPEKEIYILY